MPCCSVGYCSSEKYCKGNKAVGDACDTYSECQSNNCSITTLTHDSLVH